MSFDVVVVGGGVIGAAAAFALARDGVRVALIERGGLAGGSSSACQSGVGYGLFSEGFELLWQRAAMAAYAGLESEGIDIDYVKEGILIPSNPNGDDRPLRDRIEVLSREGLDCEWLEGRSLRTAEPNLTTSITSAALLRDVAQVSPMKVVLNLAKQAVLSGAKVLTQTRLTGVQLHRGRVVAVETSRGRIATPWIVLATGAWSRASGQLMDLQLPVWPLKGHIIVTEPSRGTLRHSISEPEYSATVRATTVAPPTSPDSPEQSQPHVASVLQPLPSGSILIGSSREFAGFDREVSRDRLAQLRDRALRLVPALSRLRVLRTYAGLRPWTPDGLPLVGPTRTVAGFILATGHAGEGITGAILTGRIVADIVSNRQPPVPLGPVSPDRFALAKRQ